MRLHEDELAVSDDVVRALVDRQLQRFASLELRRLPASGSSNVMFRLGDDLLARLPREPGGSTTIAKDAKYLPLLGVLGVLEWPVALVLAGGHALASDQHNRAVQQFGDALEDA